MDSSDPIIWRIILQVALIIINAIFSCAEIAIISINDHKLAKMSAEGNKAAQKLVALLEQPARFLSVTQISMTFAGFLASAFAADGFSDYLTRFLIARGVTLSFATLNTLSLIAITAVLAYFTLVFGELVPKRIAMRNAEKLGLGLAGFINGTAKIFTPIVWILTKSTNGILRLLRIDPHADDEEVTEEEIRLMVDAGSEKGAIDHEERAFIHNLFDFDDLTADEIMTHRRDVEILWLHDGIEQLKSTINDSDHSVFPVCGKDSDDIFGILNIKDYYRLQDKNIDTISACIQAAYFVPESVAADVLLRNMQKDRNHFAIVVDEYGGMSGVITINDLLEELVGDLEDDKTLPKEEPEIKEIGEGEWCILGTAPLDDVVQTLNIKLTNVDDIDTFGGLVFDMLETIPDDHEKPVLDGQGLHIQVNEINSRRVISANVRILPKEEK